MNFNLNNLFRDGFLSNNRLALKDLAPKQNKSALSSRRGNKKPATSEASKKLAKKIISGSAIGAFIIFGSLGCTTTTTAADYDSLPKPPAMRYASSTGQY